jgi:hypothetical protein
MNISMTTVQIPAEKRALVLGFLMNFKTANSIITPTHKIPTNKAQSLIYPLLHVCSSSIKRAIESIAILKKTIAKANGDRYSRGKSGQWNRKAA